MPIWIFWKEFVSTCVPCHKCSIDPFFNRVLLLIFESPFLVENIQKHCYTENTGFVLVCGKWILKIDTLFTVQVNDKQLYHWVTPDQTRGTHCSLQAIFQIFLVLCHRSREVNFTLPHCWAPKWYFSSSSVAVKDRLTEYKGSGDDSSSVNKRWT